MGLISNFSVILSEKQDLALQYREHQLTTRKNSSFSLSRTSLSFQNNSQSSSLMAEGAIFIFNESSFSSDIINVGI